MLSAILIGNNIVNISASSLATILATHWLGSAGAGISTGALTLIVLVFGEVTPKTCATIDPEKQSLRSAQINLYLDADCYTADLYCQSSDHGTDVSHAGGSTGKK